ALGVQQHARHFTGGLQDKCVGAGRVQLEQAKGLGVDLGEQTQLREVAADQGEVVFVVKLAQAADAIHRALVTDPATQSVGRLSRREQEAAAANALGVLLYQPRLGGVRVNLEELAHV